MDEEQMWKGFYNKLQEIKMNPPTEHETKLQDSDDGFFEKFGHLLSQKSQLDESVFQTSLAPFSEEEETIPDNPEDGSCTDSGLESKEGECIEMDVQSLQSIPTTDDMREAVFDSAICMNVSTNQVNNANTIIAR